ncbi:DUF3000 domain-containing protein [Streptomyces sp. WMMB 714]|uniref:DUF3000 domain-containing protein n=1 Tax=Streptomyces sp. WMMB 714 TaxID=1286822 RepID=UPI0005F85453|nr:DUF3000 domain-containing protein [Streptomyces sp. WMMB 714]
MAAARPQMTEGSGSSGGGGDSAPLPFQRAVAALNAARTRPEVQLSALPAPKRLAPYTFALSASVTDPEAEGGDGDPPELADGRFVLLHDPSGQESWQGTFRVVTLGRTELEPEMAGDPLLPEVTWSWLTGALETRSATYGDPSGTVTRSGSSYFGGLEERPPQSELEIRASWTPRPDDPAAPDALPDMAAHLSAWAELLCQCAGLPPEQGDGASVVTLPKRRGPQPL